MTSKFQSAALSRTLRTFMFALVVLGGFFPVMPASAKEVVHNFEDLTTFTVSVENGNAAALRGVYVPNVLALPVVQQAGGNAGYVSMDENVVTQFNLAAQMGNVGLLAHNNLAGKVFADLQQGDKVYLVYGDGHLETFQVTQFMQYQALDPYSPYSGFKDLDTQQTLTAVNLFNLVYRGARHVTFQTCIDANGNSSWGRLFVIAEPVSVDTATVTETFTDVLPADIWGAE